MKGLGSAWEWRGQACCLRFGIKEGLAEKMTFEQRRMWALKVCEEELSRQREKQVPRS